MKTIFQGKVLILLSIFIFSIYQSNAQLQPTLLSRVDSELAGFDPSLAPFYHGVASGDPLPDRVIIWTRVTLDFALPVNVSWVMAKDPYLRQVVRTGSVWTDINVDYTVKVDVDGLQPNTTYYYGFSVLGTKSLTGRTKTAPIADVNNLKFAVVSCNNYQQGYFNAFARISERNDLNAVIHLGDYIYEYEEGGYGYSEEVGRGHEPTNEAVSLTDYRVRYSYYKLDSDLRKLHQQYAFINIWDDHEFADNAYRDGAKNHQTDSEGTWSNRKANAFKAYFEWTPIRAQQQNPTRIYRKLKYGNLLDIMLVDTRIEGRDKQDEGGLFLTANALSKAGEDVNALLPNKSWGEKKELIIEKFLLSMLNVDTTIDNSDPKDGIVDKSEWAFVQQEIKAIVEQYNDTTSFEELELDAALVKQLNDILTSGTKKSLTAKKATQSATANKKLLGQDQFSWITSELRNSKAQWKILGNQVMLMPFNGVPSTDGWAGYPEERERFLKNLRSNSVNNVVVVTGDIHCSFSGDVPAIGEFYWPFNGSGSQAVEFVTPSISSANFRELSPVPVGWLKYILPLFNTHMKGIDLENHGYMILDVNKDRVQSDWYFVNDIRTSNTNQYHAMSFKVDNNKNCVKSAGAPAIKTIGSDSEPAPFSPASSTGTFYNAIQLLGVYPNPSSDKADVHYALGNAQHLNIALYNDQGVLVKSIFNGEQSAGVYNIIVDLSSMNNGVYFCKLVTNEFETSYKLVVNK